MGIKPNRHSVNQKLAWNIADHVFAKPSPRLQRLYGSPQDYVMKKADGRGCKVSFLRYFDVSATEEALEDRIAERESNSNLGFLPVQLDDTSYKVYIYRINSLPD